MFYRLTLGSFSTASARAYLQIQNKIGNRHAKSKLHFLTLLLEGITRPTGSFQKYYRCIFHCRHCFIRIFLFFCKIFLKLKSKSPIIQQFDTVSKNAVLILHARPCL